MKMFLSRQFIVFFIHTLPSALVYHKKLFCFCLCYHEGMKKDLLKAMDQLGFSFLLPIQEKTIPLLLNGKDLLIQAPTGAGKTLCYLVPAINAVDKNEMHTKVLIMTPTRELALQVSDTANKLVSLTGNHVVTLIGGLDIGKQINALKHRPQILIGTPGRIKDLLNQKQLDLSQVSFVVFDEADQIQSTGQGEDVKYIQSFLPVHQTVALSATITEYTKALFPGKYEEVLSEEGINQNISSYYVETQERKKTLKKLLTFLPIESCIVFTNYKNDANVIADWLKEMKIRAAAFSSFFDEPQRIAILRDFRQGKTRVLVATDAAARGLDISGVSHIIHYDIPTDIETWIHRSGRTAHQGNTGTSIALLREDNEVAQYIKIHSKPLVYQKTQNDLSKKLEKKAGKKTDTMTLFIHAGRKDKVRPKDIIGALCTKMDFSMIGTLEIQDTYSTVIILKNDPELAKSLRHLSIKGKQRRIDLH